MSDKETRYNFRSDPRRAITYLTVSTLFCGLVGYTVAKVAEAWLG